MRWAMTSVLLAMLVVALCHLAQAADTRNILAKQIYGCSWKHKEMGFSDDDLRAIGFTNQDVDDAKRLYGLAEATSTGAFHDIALAITAGESSDGEAFGIPGAKHVPFVSPLGLLKMLLQIVSKKVCGLDAAEVVFEAVPGAGILWRIVSFLRDLESVEDAAGYVAKAPVLPPLVRRFGQAVKETVKPPTRSARTLSKSILDKCEELNPAWTTVVYATRILTLAQYTFMTLDYVIFPYFNLLACVSINDLFRLHLQQHPHYVPVSRQSGRRLLLEQGMLNVTNSSTYNRLLQQSSSSPSVHELLDGMSSEDPFHPLLSAVDLVEATGSQLLKASKDLQDIFDAEDLGAVVDTIKQAEAVVEQAARSLEFLDVLSPIFDLASKILSYIKCPSFLSFVCDLSTLIQDALNSALRAIGVDLEKIIHELLSTIGVSLPSFELPSLGRLDVFSTLASPINRTRDQVKAQVQSLASNFNLGPYFNALNDYRINASTPFLPQGVRLTYTIATNGGAATLSCNAGEYPVVQDAVRTIFQCKQDLSAFMRFPCPTIETSTCTVDYDKTFPSTCKDEVAAKPLFPQPSDYKEMLSFIGISKDGLGVEDRFTAFYYCVRRNVTFDVLGELVTLQGILKVEKHPSSRWRFAGGPSIKTVKHGFRSGNTILPDGGGLTCGGGRVLFMEHIKRAAAASGQVAAAAFFSSTDYESRQNIAQGSPEHPSFYTGAFGSGSDPCFDFSWLGDNSAFGDPVTSAQVQSQYKYDLCALLHSTDADGNFKPVTGVVYDRWADTYPWKCAGDGTADHGLAVLRSNKSRFAVIVPNSWSAFNCVPYDLNLAEVWFRSTGCDTFKGAEYNCFTSLNKQVNFVPLLCTGQIFSESSNFYGMLFCLTALDAHGPAAGQRSRKGIEVSYLQANIAPPCTLELPAACIGQPHCNYMTARSSSCNVWPGTLQYACVEDQYHYGLSGGVDRLTYIFGDSQRLDGRTRNVSCEAGKVVTLQHADLGEVFSSTDVTDQLAARCTDDGSQCTWSLTDVATGDVAGKVLRIKYSCFCAAGYYMQPAVNGSCTPCPAGQYRTLAMSTCSLCPPGSFSAASPSTSCTSCGAGMYVESQGATACSGCAAGTYNPKSGSSNRTDCLPCPINTASGNTSAACQDCTDGTEAPAPGRSSTGATFCPNCTMGNYRSGKMPACAPCPTGQYADRPGLSACTDCPPGTYAAGQGTPQCPSCPTGTYQDEQGQDTCKLCPDGYYTASRGATAAADCIEDKPLDQLVLLAANDKAYDDAECAKLLASFGIKELPAIPYDAQLNITGTPAAPITRDIGNSLCNPGPHNTRVCGWDGGDCCPRTCKVLDSTDNTTTNSQYRCSPVTFDCQDPEASLPPATDNCAPDDSANASAAGPLAICPQNVLSDSRWGNGFCDDDLNLEGACAFDKGDCCPSTCRFNPLIEGSCARFNCRAKPSGGVDVIPPALRGVPPDGTAPSNAVLIATVTATDNWPACFNYNVTLTTARNDRPSNITAAAYLYQLVHTWSSTDHSGNKVTASQTVTVLDVEPPVFANVPNDTAVQCDAVPAATALNPTDNDPSFATTAVAPKDTVTPGACPANYTIARQWSASDAAGNKGTGNQTIEVYDTKPPVYPAGDGVKACIYGPHDRVYLFENFSKNATFGLISISDACSNATGLKQEFISCTPSVELRTCGANCTYNAAKDVLTVPALNIGSNDITYTITWRVTDPCGNVLTAAPAVTAVGNKNTLPAACKGSYELAVEVPSG